MLKTVKRLLRNEDGAAAVEYALIAALIGVAIAAAATGLATSISATFDNVAGKL